MFIKLKLRAEVVMGRNGMGRKGHGPKWSWAEMVMGQNDPEPACFVLFSCYSQQSISDYSWEVYIVHSGVFAG